MALDPRKRQKKLAKRKAQRKEKAKSLVVQQQQHLAYQTNRVALAARYPMHDCLVSKNIFQSGMGSIIFSRLAPNGDIVTGMFLIDAYCLGVKSAFARFLLPREYEQMVAKTTSNEWLDNVSPSYARKLVEEAVAYAAKLGFRPDPDYNTAKDIFGAVEVNDCTEEFTFGQDGKPHYISGPLDSPLRRQQIVATLEKTCGTGNYHYTMMLGDPFFGDEGEYDDDDFEDDYEDTEDEER